MKVTVKGQGEVSLTNKNFVAQGGEGAVYVKGSSAFKIYTDPRKMIPQGKFQELSKITDPLVIKPERVVLSIKGDPIGYTMRFVTDTHTLCQLFTRTFKERNSIEPQVSLELVRGMQQTVKNVHNSDILIVDLNEMNFLVNAKFTEVYFIDVDSYQTKHYPATAIMPSIRDWHTPLGKFTRESDWFSFAIVSFQMLIGIHPYKGKHAKIKGMEDRMKQNISVFNSDVRLPKVCYPLDVIPQVYRDWFKAVLEDGKRVAPPFDMNAVAIIARSFRIIHSSQALDINEIESFSSEVIDFFSKDGTDLVRTIGGFFLDRRRVCDNANGPVGVAFTPKMGKVIIASSLPNLKLFNATDKKDISLPISADEVSSYDGRIYVRNKDKVFEVLFHENNNRIIAATHLIANVLEHASKLYRGVVVQNLMGSTFVSVLDKSKTSYQFHIKELDKYRILDAKYENKVLVVIGADSNTYDRLVFVFNDDFSAYSMRVVSDVAFTGLNFTVLDSGVCVLLTEDEKLELFSNKYGSKSVKVIEDSTLGNDMILSRIGGRAVFYKDQKVYSIAMK